MKIRKYEARNMSEALQQVREDLGEGAVILNSRQIRRNNRFNLHDEARVEVTAAYDEVPAAASSAAVRPPPAPTMPLNVQRYVAQAGHEEAPVPPAPAAMTSPTPASSVDMSPVLEQLRQLRQDLSRVEQRVPGGVVLPETLSRLAERMGNMGLEEAIIARVVQQLLEELDGEALQDRTRVGERAGALLVEELPPLKDIKIARKGRKVVGFVGPSGAGKTTAMAKIAAGFAVKRKGRIVLISADDKRIGALDQARAFTEIIGVTLEVAYNPEDIKAVLAAHEDAQLILIDTPGCGPHDHREWERLRLLFDAAAVDEVQVVVDSLLGLDHMLDIVEASENMVERRLLFTKMDEMVRPGAALSVVISSQISTSYFTVGATVPGAIKAGDMAKQISELIGVAPATGKKRGK